ncbi:hypothetical protein ACGF8B_25660 [Streptomyces sp. NPDC047917]|uniref:hypothetical protein n=1 Tax=Streptomyces sp. NPDC047917 TaxID=3365491 RepID=UPI0037167F2A
MITCSTVDADGPIVFGNTLNTNHWGPLSNFIISDRNNKYSCQGGWAEGTLWVSGQNCRQA